MTTTATSCIDKALQLNGGYAAIGMAACYICMFILFGALLSFPETSDILETLYYIGEQHVLLAVTYSVGYLLFGCLLIVTVQAAHNRLQQGRSALLNTASLFGLIWVCLMMCAGMTVLIGMDMILDLVKDKPNVAIALFYSNNMIVNSLGGGIELVGGLWVLLISIVGLRGQQFSKGLNWLGIWVGAFGVLTVFHTVPYLKDIFGLSQIIWFVWLGIELLNTKYVSAKLSD